MEFDKEKHRDFFERPVGVVGMGLMGASITTCLLVAGHEVIGVDVDPIKRREALDRVGKFLDEIASEVGKDVDAERLLGNFTVTGEFESLAPCPLVVESISESLEAKRGVIAQIESAVRSDAIIGSNTSALPITSLQAEARNPERIFGIHWAEPAHLIRFIEVICGDQSSLKGARRVVSLSKLWDKDASLIRKDAKGFVCNRIWYAMLREACNIVEQGIASIEDVDRSIRNDLGSWIAVTGIFRYLDLTGGPKSYHTVMKDLLPDLSRDIEVPRLLRDLDRSGAEGTRNLRGFYSYSPEEAEMWEERFHRISSDINKLIRNYGPAGSSNSSPKEKEGAVLKEEVKHPDKAVNTGAYSDAVRIDNDFVFVSGQGPLDLAEGTVQRGTVGEETLLTLSHVEKILKQAGCTVDNIVRISVYLSDINDFDEFNKIYSEFFAERNVKVLPARTTIQSNLWNNIKIEIDCIARL